MDTLQEICTRKKEHIATKKQKSSLEDLRCKIADTAPPLGFLKALKNKADPVLIAEVKKASPSKGVIRADFDPVQIASIYECAGACCISVLTDEPYFQGHDDYLTAVKQAVALPVLRKDFMIDPYQIYESRSLGADCILLIMAALNDDTARMLYDIATELGMDVLVEVHNKEELDRALALEPMMVGVNNRNLKTLQVDVATSYDLLKAMPDDVYKISESGIVDFSTVSSLYGTGYKAFLVGESLMRQDDIALAVADLLGK